VRVAMMVILLALIAFCIFGFVATFEPMDPAKAMTWRIIYGVAALASIVAVAWNIRPRK
jgi:hypothetical protein